MKESLAKIKFNEEKHEYWYGDKQLYGITGVIGKMMGKSFPDTLTVQAASIYGSDVHKEAENWIKEKKEPSTESGKWLIKTLQEFEKDCKGIGYESEVMVSDLEGTASKVDIVMHTRQGAFLFDIKTTSHFDRPYCSLQLSVYRKLYEKCYGEQVLGLFVLGTKVKRLFRIFVQEDKYVDKVLEENKRKGK